MQINNTGSIVHFLINVILNSYKLHIIEVLINFTIYLLNYYKASKNLYINRMHIGCFQGQTVTRGRDI